LTQTIVRTLLQFEFIKPKIEQIQCTICTKWITKISNFKF